ncbi:hypothetical protein [Treponema sp. Marseille-Q4130]|uniref:hypothetical protein n=1 Tax=Treponema sp. Marseille-Q4130 TaxID=2766702 RepID=UPI001652AD98|nr:hypothetical protein [Treponema sp. Marseille-Q4130]MBC6719864.1 hypothetical protein [Treponema sp. Marseille-Q4130]
MGGNISKKSRGGKNRPQAKRQQAKPKRLSEKRRSLIVVIFALFAAAAGVFGIARYKDDRRLDVAYYGISENIVKAIGETFENPDNAMLQKNYSRVRTVQLTEKDIRNAKRIAKTYDLLFMWNGILATDAAGKAISIPENVYNLFPVSVRNAGKVDSAYKMLPLLLNHYELACYRTYRNNAALALPETFADFESYLQIVKSYADYPLICAGKTDATLTAFVSALTESLAGSEGYAALVKAAANANGLSDLLDVPLGNGISLSSVLGTIKRWQRDRLIHPHWYNVTEKDIENYMEEHRLGAIFMPLSEHRQKPLILIKYYDAVQFPKGDGTRHTLIAPALVGMAFRNNASQISILESLAHTDVQTFLSLQTKLAPTSGRAEAHDLQADDVRFWAASCTDGPVTELGQAAFASQAKIAAFAEEIRAYMSAD